MERQNLPSVYIALHEQEAIVLLVEHGLHPIESIASRSSQLTLCNFARNTTKDSFSNHEYLDTPSTNGKRIEGNG